MTAATVGFDDHASPSSTAPPPISLEQAERVTALIRDHLDTGGRS